MSDNKKYYYLKLKDSFFDSEELIVLQDMENGYIYSDILLKLYLRSLKNEGKLMFNDTISYTTSMLAKVVRHDESIVSDALEIFKSLGLIEVLENGAIYMLNIQNFIGKSSTEADRQREYQSRIAVDKCKETNKKSCKETNKKSNIKSTPEKEIEKEIEIKKNNSCASEDARYPDFFNDLWLEFAKAYPNPKYKYSGKANYMKILLEADNPLEYAKVLLEAVLLYGNETENRNMLGIIAWLKEDNRNLWVNKVRNQQSE